MDEGGSSAPGGWRNCITEWHNNVAMPHGWAVAELVHLIRDSLVFEDTDNVAVFCGIPESWYTSENPIMVVDLPTHFGNFSASYQFDSTENSAIMGINIARNPTNDTKLCWPENLNASFFDMTTGEKLTYQNGIVFIPVSVTKIKIVM